MALGPSIFLPCNHSGALLLFIFSKAIARYNKDIKIVLTKIEFCFVIFTLGCNCVKVAKYDQRSTNALEQ